MAELWSTEKIINEKVKINDRDDKMKWAYPVGIISNLDKKIQKNDICRAEVALVMNCQQKDYHQLHAVGIYTTDIDKDSLKNDAFSEDAIKKYFDEVLFFGGMNVKRKTHHDPRNWGCNFQYNAVHVGSLVALVRGVLVTTSNEKDFITIPKMRFTLTKY